MSRVRTGRRACARGPRGLRSGCSLFNVLLVFLPVAGFLYLDVYESSLLEEQERAWCSRRGSWRRRSPSSPTCPRSAAGSVRSGCSIGSSNRPTSGCGWSPATGASSPIRSAWPASRGARTPPRPARRNCVSLRGRWTYRAGAWLGRRWRALTAADSHPPARRDDPGRPRAHQGARSRPRLRRRLRRHRPACRPAVSDR